MDGKPHRLYTPLLLVGIILVELAYGVPVFSGKMIPSVTHSAMHIFTLHFQCCYRPSNLGFLRWEKSFVCTESLILHQYAALKADLE